MEDRQYEDYGRPEEERLNRDEIAEKRARSKFDDYRHGDGEREVSKTNREFLKEIRS